MVIFVKHTNEYVYQFRAISTPMITPFYTKYDDITVIVFLANFLPYDSSNCPIKASPEF